MKQSIFIIDDDSVDREFFKIMFGLYGFRIDVADSPEQGLRLLKERKPDLIFIDSHLTQGDSLEIVKTIKYDTEYTDISSVPIMMLSEDRNPDTKLAGYEIGVEHYITKPYNFLEILARVRVVFRAQELKGQVVNRERRLALVESLNSSLVYFSRHLRTPMLDLHTKANIILQNPSSSSDKEVIDYITRVREEAEATIMALDNLEHEVNELSCKGEEMKSNELTPEWLEQKYREHFSQYHDEVVKMQYERGLINGQEHTQTDDRHDDSNRA